jgi:hypothetical protein
MRNFRCFRPNPNPLYGPYYSYLPVKSEVWKDVGEKLDRHGKLYVIQSNADITPPWLSFHGSLWIEIPYYLTFWGPCFVIYSYDRSQQDALFLNFILTYNSTYFGQTYCPSSGLLILYSQQLVFVILFMLAVNVNSMTYTSCCEYSIKTPDDGQYVCPKYVELYVKIK